MGELSGAAARTGILRKKETEITWNTWEYECGNKTKTTTR